MAQVITISITESEEQLLHGIPKSVILETNIPSTIYYTFDGSIPSSSSSIYINGDLELPTNQTTVILSLFATDGVDTSPVISRTYQPNITSLRQAHDEVTIQGAGGCCDRPHFPYGDLQPDPPGIYHNIGGDVVNRPDVQNSTDGYGWDGTATNTGVGFTDRPLDTYNLVFSEANEQGERGHGIGTLPTNVTVRQPDPPPISSNMNDRLFNPKALVIYQDGTQEPFDPNILQINRQYFSLENPEFVKDGTLLNTTSMEGLGPTGSFTRAHFNPKDNTITYYYFDSQTLRWIISKEPYQATNNTGGLYNIVFSSRDRGARFVYKWRPFIGRRAI